jgi:hypothetical protein
VKTIARTATRKIAALKATIDHITMYDQNRGAMVPIVNTEGAWHDLATYDFARLVDNENGTYNINIHGNRWFVLHTEPVAAPVTDFVEVGRQARRDGQHGAPALNPVVMAALDGIPVGGGGTEIMLAFQKGYEEIVDAECAAILAADRPTPGVTVTRTRRSIATQLREFFAAHGIAWEIGQHQGRTAYIVAGEPLTPGEAADKYLPGGFAAAFGAR